MYRSFPSSPFPRLPFTMIIICRLCWLYWKWTLTVEFPVSGCTATSCIVCSFSIVLSRIIVLYCFLPEIAFGLLLSFGKNIICLYIRYILLFILFCRIIPSSLVTVILVSFYSSKIAFFVLTPYPVLLFNIRSIVCKLLSFADNRPYVCLQMSLCLFQTTWWYGSGQAEGWNL